MPAPPPPEEYRWKKGQSGNPGGRPKRKPLTDLMLEALSETDAKGQTLMRSIIERWALEVMGGSASHLKELLERVEGKVSDGVTQEDETEAPKRIIVPSIDARHKTSED